ncbi:uncharacterized protein EI97DRAFT_477771 [Westerdykella ornata]|uniref:CENP-V/GFA domain-containing protein n=1 Tax=Westerdykella ornata TaxID=318751 RepID=A0A6A6JV65_WESOR|nr:uncharacterized protein EI97DRAFT_477771 [Westerdykella ornata]KAF2280135.1 hypothetical protein EI97DRAFT_477771 [Westerdykella ornata]
MGDSAVKKTTGSCLCGAITFELHGEPISNCLCFCNSCRKSTGSIGMANSWYKKENFRILTGEDKLRIFYDNTPDSGGQIERSFCTECGSTMVAENKGKFPGAVIVPVGAMDVDLRDGEWKPSQEYFCKRRANWLEIKAETKEFWELF